MTGSRRLSVTAGALGVVAVLFWVWLVLEPDSGSGGTDADPGVEGAPLRRAAKGASAKEAAGGRPPERAKDAKRRKWVAIDEFEDLSAADRKLAESVQAAMDGDDHRQIIKAAGAALVSTNLTVRQEAIEALGWCGKDALAELTGLLAENDDDLRSRVIDHWESALAEVESPKIRYATALAVMGTITEEDALDSISGQFSNAAEEYIDEVDDEEAQNERRVEVIQLLHDVISGSKDVCAAKAKEAYGDLTGHEWISAEEAERYLSDPDGYEEPEDRQESAVSDR